MRGKRAKEIRREVYGDASICQERKYKRIPRGFKLNKKGQQIDIFSIINDPDSLRAKYLKFKREYKAAMKLGIA